MNISILNSIFSYLQGDGAVILPEMQLTVFGLGILLIGFSVDDSMENDWFWKLVFKDFSAKAAFAGVLFSGLSLWKLRGRVAASGTLAGFHESVVVDGFLIFLRRAFSCGHRAGDSPVREVSGNRGRTAGGILRVAAFCLRGHDVDGVWHGSDRHVPRAGDDGAELLRADRFSCDARNVRTRPRSNTSYSGLSAQGFSLTDFHFFMG